MKLSNSKGDVLVEVLVALLIFTLFLFMTMQSIMKNLQDSSEIVKHNRATLYLNDYAELLKANNNQIPEDEFALWQKKVLTNLNGKAQISEGTTEVKIAIKYLNSKQAITTIGKLLD